MTVRPALAFERTPEQRGDAALSWARPDAAFFAAGACHQLAFVARQRTPGSEIVHLRPRAGVGGSHMLVRAGERGFDFNGWSDFAVLVEVNENAGRDRYGDDWTCDLVAVPGDVAGFEAYCSANGHRLAGDFAGDVRTRAETFIAAVSVP